MIDLTLPKVRWRVSDGPPGLKECPGRNGMTEQWKVKRGELNKRTGKTHRAVQHECVIVLKKRKG